ncbi:MAG: elongation factor P hydroxylase [Porticoccaceae bacterium]|nr:elongation factor P hydroxylase [Porticoccaceae bacterium]
MTAVESAVLEQLFAETFFNDWNTLLTGGGHEPIYLPADQDHRHHRIIYREDYFSSALHETAHWCVAGEARRKLVDFGYWYQPDGRTRDQQQAFEQVEVKPQALEWLFTAATGRVFRPSADNLSGPDPDSRGPSVAFLDAIATQARQWCIEGGMPPRGRLFVERLAAHYGVEAPFDPDRYQDLAP